MIEVKDRVPTQPNRFKVTDESGEVSYITLERADVPTETGTPINAALFQSIDEDITDVKANLVAENDVSFKFSYDEESEQYGWKDADEVFHPFSNATKLYEALKDSGLVEEGMTYDEMCEALSWFFDARSIDSGTRIIDSSYGTSNTTEQAYSPTYYSEKALTPTSSAKTKFVFNGAYNVKIYVYAQHQHGYTSASLRCLINGVEIVKSAESQEASKTLNVTKGDTIEFRGITNSTGYTKTKTFYVMVNSVASN